MIFLCIFSRDPKSIWRRDGQPVFWDSSIEPTIHEIKFYILIEISDSDIFLKNTWMNTIAEASECNHQLPHWIMLPIVQLLLWFSFILLTENVRYRTIRSFTSKYSPLIFFYYFFAVYHEHFGWRLSVCVNVKNWKSLPKPLAKTRDRAKNEKQNHISHVQSTHFMFWNYNQMVKHLLLVWERPNLFNCLGRHSYAWMFVPIQINDFVEFEFRMNELQFTTFAHKFEFVVRSRQHQETKMLFDGDIDVYQL